jgi:replication factor C subunit 2/4
VQLNNKRGIDVVRNRIKMFAQRKVSLPPHCHKIIILDEADRYDLDLQNLLISISDLQIAFGKSMTAGAQQALRRTMEIYSSTTRFALACNMSSKIIEPIQSRCAILRYAPLQEEQILSRLVEICIAENVKYTPDGLEALIFTAEGKYLYNLVS